MEKHKKDQKEYEQFLRNNGTHVFDEINIVPSED
jgi:hypothetical protein